MRGSPQGMGAGLLQFSDHPYSGQYGLENKRHLYEVLKKHNFKCPLRSSTIRDLNQLRITLPPCTYRSGLFVIGRSIYGEKIFTFVRLVPPGSDKVQLKWQAALHGDELSFR